MRVGEKRQDGPTMDSFQIELWKQQMLNPKPKHHVVPGPAMVINNHRAGKNRPKERAEKPVGACVHHWRISEPNGPTCEGRCQKCGMLRTYTTAPDDVNTSLTVRTDKVGRW